MGPPHEQQAEGEEVMDTETTTEPADDLLDDLFASEHRLPVLAARGADVERRINQRRTERGARNAWAAGRTIERTIR
jgi:hypothetical protein